MRTADYPPNENRTDAPAAYRWRWQPEGDDWRVIPRGGFSIPCRAPRCHTRSIAQLNRGRRGRDGVTRDAWWSYCPDHLYGRIVWHGLVWVEVLEELPAPPPFNPDLDLIGDMHKREEP